MYGGQVPYGSLFSFFQRLGMVGHLKVTGIRGVIAKTKL
jgi:hypothetical protein